jgi:hypothetical protein
VQFQASFTNGGYIQTGGNVQFGFLSNENDAVCFYKPGSTKRGYPLSRQAVITLTEDIGPDNTYGDVIPLETVAGIVKPEDLRACLRADVFVIVDQNIRVLCGSKDCEREHALMSFDNLYWYLPSFFNCENADRMVGRMTQYMPERQWQAIPLAELAAYLLGLALAA